MTNISKRVFILIVSSVYFLHELPERPTTFIFISSLTLVLKLGFVCDRIIISVLLVFPAQTELHSDLIHPSVGHFIVTVSM